MRILLLSKALVSAPYQKKCEELAKLPGVELTVAVPESWREPRVGTLPLDARFTSGYQLMALPIALNGNHHVHWYPTLSRLVRRLQPQIFHIDEESFNLATFQAMRLGVEVSARCCFYNYANIDRYYPPPFSLFERYNFRHACHGFAANRDAETILRRHGYTGPLSIIPQFGVDQELYSPSPPSPLSPSSEDRGLQSAQPTWIIGYIGRLVPEKGIFDLIRAVKSLPQYIQLRLIGDGSQRDEILTLIAQLGLQTRVELHPWVSDVAQELRMLDVLVLPSRTTPTWKEQFGRIMIEAMSCGIPVIGSSSGEIPHVVGDAGLIFREGDCADLATKLHMLMENPKLQAELAERGHARVLQHYTQAAIAQRYYKIYQSMLSDTQS
jgi:glycosyltransferase involved in cell wall biosynthesis